MPRLAIVTRGLLVCSWVPGLLAVARAEADLVPRLVFVESFGSPDCPDCTDARTALESLELVFDEEAMAYVEYHTEPPLSNAETTARDSYYGNTESPTIWFDGVDARDASGVPADVYHGVIDSRLASGAQITMSSDYFFDDAPAIVDIDLTVAEGETIQNPAECVVRGVIYEDEVEFCCGEDGRRQWNRIARAFLPEVTLTAVRSGETQAITHTLSVDPGWDVDRLRVIAFVQRDSDRSILNAARAIDAGALNPIPEVPPGFDSSLNIVPNPALNQTRISWTLGQETWVHLRIFDANGRVVRVLNDGIRPEGEGGVTWNGADFAGLRMASGVYVVDFATPQGRNTKTMVLLR
jgi:glutaredoxin